MTLDDIIRLFMDSRRRGVTGARKKSSPATLHIYAHNMKVFTDFLQAEVEGGGVTKYEQVKRLHMVQFLDWLDKQLSSGTWSKASCLQILRTLRTFFRWVDMDEDCQGAGLKGLQKYLPAIEKNPRRTDIPQIKDLKVFKNGFNTTNRWGYRDYVAACLMMNTGIRLGEVCNLRLDALLLEEPRIIVRGKQGARTVPITTEMVKLLKGWLKRRETCKTATESPYVFVSKRAPKMEVTAFGQRFRKHRKKLNLPRISAHSLRHSFCTKFLAEGGNIETLRLMTGHSSYEMLKDYLHLATIGGKAMHDELEKVNLLKYV